LIKRRSPKAKAPPLSLLFDASYFASSSKQTNDSEHNPDSLRPAHGVGEQRRHDLVAPLLYPWREMGQSCWRVGWHGSSCWLLCLCVLCLCFVLPPKQSSVLECHHIYHILKNENYELCFLAGSYLHQSNYDLKKKYSRLTVGWNILGFHQLGLFWRVPQSNYNRKKGTVVWPLVAMSDCFGGFIAMFFGGFLHQITNYDRKKRYSCLACLHHLQHM
jgi:hypothetical protein